MRTLRVERHLCADADGGFGSLWIDLHSDPMTTFRLNESCHSMFEMRESTRLVRASSSYRIG